MPGLGLPRLYPGELVGSGLARAVIRTGLAPKRLFRALLGDCSNSISFFLPSCLSALANCFEMDAKQLLWEHTMFPFIVSFMDAGAVRALESVALRNAQIGQRRFQFGPSATQSLYALRFCQKCLLDDLVCHGETYWHRAHCLPAVHHCNRHREPLLECEAPRPRSFAGYSTGLPQHQKQGWASARRSGAMAELLATKGVALLDRRSHGWAPWAENYRRLALEKGFVTKAFEVAGAQLATDVAAAFDPHYLDALACSIAVPARSWPALMVRPSVHGPFSPIKHILLESFLESAATGTKSLAYRSPGRPMQDFRCIDSQLAKHIRTATARALSSGKRTTVTELVQRAGYWAPFKHHRPQFSEARAAIAEFRASEASQRKSGGRAAHLRNLARRNAACQSDKK